MKPTHRKMKIYKKLIIRGSHLTARKDNYSELYFPRCLQTLRAYFMLRRPIRYIHSLPIDLINTKWCAYFSRMQTQEGVWAGLRVTYVVSHSPKLLKSLDLRGM